MVRTDPAAASSASAAADGVGDKHGGSGASGVDESCSAEAIASATLVSMDPPVKQLTRAEEAARVCAPPRLRRGCSEARRSVDAVDGSAELSGPKK